MGVGTGEGAPVRHDISGTVLSEWPATVTGVSLAGECVVLRLAGGVDADHAHEVAGLVPALAAIEAAEVEADLVGHARTMGEGWRLYVEWGSGEDSGHIMLPCRWSGAAWRVQTYAARHDPQLTLRPHLLGAMVGLDVPALVGLRGRDVRVTLRGAQLTLDEAVEETVRVSVVRE